MSKQPTHEKSTGKTAKSPKPMPSEKVVQKFDRKAEESKLIAKYPTRQIIPGSLRDSGEIEEFGQKRSIEIKCEATGKKFRIATSDLHQVRFHPDHMKQVRLERRKELRAKKVKKTTASKPARKATAPKPNGRARTVKAPVVVSASEPVAETTTT